MAKPVRKASIFVAMALALSALLTLASCSKGGQADETPAGQNVQVPENNYSFLVCGDPHGRVDLLQRIIGQARDGEFLAIVGDLTTGTGLQEMKKMKDFLDSKSLPYHVIPGDNDIPCGNLSNFHSVFGPDYYSLDMQDSHLVFLDDSIPGTGCPQDELDWLQQDLSATAGKIVIAFAHVPPGAPVTMDDVEATQRETDSAHGMLALLRNAGTTVVYSGHLHAYMLYSDGPPRIIVTGGAGAPLHLSEPSGGYYHFLRVTVNGDQVSEEIIRL